MKCPYCGDSEKVHVWGVPTVANLLNLGPFLGLGVVTMFKAAALFATYAATHKMIYKCDECDKYFIA